MGKIIYFPLSFIGAWVLHLLFFGSLREFDVKNYIHSISYEQCCPREPLVPLEEVLRQPFFYLNHGAQMIAFESKDQKFVIKFFNPRRHMRQNWHQHWEGWKKYLSYSWLTEAYFKKRERLCALFKSYDDAFCYLRKESGLIFVQLDLKKPLDKMVLLQDRDKKNHPVNLRNLPFVLQKKAQLIPAYLSSLLNKGEIQKAKDAIKEVERLFLGRSQKGFSDPHQSFSTNFGFVDGHAVQIDLGKLTPCQDKKLSLEAPLLHLKEWVMATYPQLQE